MNHNRKKTAGNFDVLNIQEFLSDALLEAKKAKKRVLIQAMLLEGGKVAKSVTEIYKAANVSDKKLYLDWFGLMVINGIPVYLKYFLLGAKRARIEEFEKKRDQAIANIKSKGVGVIFTNRPNILGKLVPFLGRNHSKVTIIDDNVYIGGINFSDENLAYVDFVVKLTDKKIASALEVLLRRENIKRDKEIVINNETKILVDSGTPGKSLILTKVKALIEGSEKIVFHVSQLAPDGEILESFEKALGRGVDLKIIIPFRNEFGFIFSFIHKLNKIIIYLKKIDLPLFIYFGMIHAKLIIIDEKYVLFGSHNLSRKGVVAGTKEISILTSNRKLVKNLLKFYIALLEQSKLQ